jgi:hypothetical protein
MIIERVKGGMPFDQAVAEVEAIGQFTCEKWWKDLNRSVITETYGPGSKPAADPRKGK